MFTVKEEDAALVSGELESRADADELSKLCPRGVWLVLDDNGQRVAAFRNGDNVSVREEKTMNHRVEAMLAAIRNYHRARRSAKVDGEGIVVRDRAVVKADVALLEAIIGATDEEVDAAYSGAAQCDDAAMLANSRRAAEKIRRWALVAPEAVAGLLADERKKLG